MDNLKIIWGGIIIAIILAIVGMVGGNNQSGPSFSGVTNYDALELTDGLMSNGSTTQISTLKVGLANGSSLTQIISGTGTLIYSDSQVTASTSKAFDIAVTGVVSTDKVFVQTATTTAASLGWHIQGASASTTAGYITLIIGNLTGATGNVPRNIASSTSYLIIR